MNTRDLAKTLVLSLCLTPVAQAAAQSDEAKPREGGSPGGRAQSAGERHHSSDGGRSSSASSDAGGSSAAGSGSSFQGEAPLTDAQRRHPRAGTGTGHRDGRIHFGYPYSRAYYYGYPYSRFSYYGYYPFADYWYSGYYGGYDPYRGYRSYYRDTGSMRILVEPSETRVYVDGYYAGVADDFDGIFQRLHLSPGRHDISLKLEGYRTHHFKVYVPVGHTIKLHHDMVRGSGEDTVTEDLSGEGREYDRSEDRASRESDQPRETGSSSREDRGTLRLDVEPDDASVYVDGEFRGTGRQARSLDLPPGRHRIEVVRPGFRTVEREVEIRSGRTTVLGVDLERS